MGKIKWKNINWLLLVLCILSFIAHLILYPRFPDQIPIHWGINGAVDRYGSKLSVLLLAALPLFIYLFFHVMPLLDPRRQNYKHHAKAYRVSLCFTVLLLMVFNWVTSLFALGYPMDIPQIITFGVGLLLIVMGNYMPQIRQNYYFGIRTSWAIANTWVWKKTQRMGGILYVLMGLGILILSFLPDSVQFPVFMTILLGGTGWLYLYSYLVFLKAKKTGRLGSSDLSEEERTDSSNHKNDSFS